MILFVRVKPGSNPSKGEEIAQDDATHYTVRVRERAIDGRANDAVIRTLAKHFGCAKSSILIKSGHASRLKKIEIPSL